MRQASSWTERLKVGFALSVTTSLFLSHQASSRRQPMFDLQPSNSSLQDQLQLQLALHFHFHPRSSLIITFISCQTPLLPPQHQPQPQSQPSFWLQPPPWPAAPPSSLARGTTRPQCRPPKAALRPSN